MKFTSPSWVPEPPAIPDSMMVGEFVMDRHKSFYRWSNERPSLICAASGRSYDMLEINSRVDLLSRSLSSDLKWETTQVSENDRFVAVFSFNTIDFMITTWAIHRAGGTCLLLHPTSSAAEIEAHLKRAKCNVIFTNHRLVATAQKAMAEPIAKIYVLEMPEDSLDSRSANSLQLETVNEMVIRGRTFPPLEQFKLSPGESRERVAYLCPTSGTSGKQKLAQLTHYNMMANCIQAATHENPFKEGRTETGLGILPLSHSYALVLGHLTAWRGDCLVIHAQFDMQKTLASISEYKIERLYLVPSIIQALIGNSFLFQMFDLSSVETVVTGSAAFGLKMVKALKQAQPSWKIQPGYGLTESGVIISFTVPEHTLLGSDGCLLPMVEARLVREDGSEVQAHGESGELYLQAPSVVRGYFGEEDGNVTPFDDSGWLRTGDIAMFKQDNEGTSHLHIIDRKKDIMKVKGLQVAPVEIEAHLVSHPAVAEAAVISVPDEDAGERPFAFIVRSEKEMSEESEQIVTRSINQHVESTLSEPHWLRKNIAFVASIPKSHNGKALKFKLRESLPQRLRL